MDPVGIRKAQSLLRSATQGSLSFFHTAGMTNTFENVQKPSVADAMDSKYTSKNTSMTFMYAGNPGFLKKSIVCKQLRWFVNNISSNITGLPEYEDIWYDALDETIYEGQVIRFYVDYLKLLEYDITLRELAQRSFEEPVIYHVSPDFMGMIDIDLPDTYVSKYLSKMFARVCGVINITSCDIVLSSRSAIFAPDDKTADTTSYKSIINESQGNTERNVKPKKIEYAAITKGSNIMAISRVLGVYKNTIQSNNVKDVQKCLGIEAAAKALNAIMGPEISDFMTRTGKVLPFNKQSIEVRNKGILTSTGFERPKNDITAALVSGKWDTSVSVYANIMTGTDPLNGFSIKY